MAKKAGRWIKSGAIGCGDVVLTIESGSWYDCRWRTVLDGPIPWP